MTANTANTVIPAKAGIQYADSGVRALLETPCLMRQVNATAGLHFTDWVLDSRLRGNDGQRPSTQRLRYPLFLWVNA